MPSNNTGWFIHSLARETGKIGNLVSPGRTYRPYPWIPYACDNGVFSLWNRNTNEFNFTAWHGKAEKKWRDFIIKCHFAAQQPLWAIVPDVPGNGKATMEWWKTYSPEVIKAGIPTAIAVQDGMKPDDIKSLDPLPEVICVGGSTEWKWQTLEEWAGSFTRVHLLRCNSPDKLEDLASLGLESIDGTGWTKDRRKADGLEQWCRKNPQGNFPLLSPHICRKEDTRQLCFA
jgi:hypothetical protein